MFVNDEEVGAHKTHGTDQEVTMDWDRRTFFGRALTNMRDERYVVVAVLLLKVVIITNLGQRQKSA